MVDAVAGEGQPPALDGVREQHRGPASLAIGRTQRSIEHVQVVTAQVGEQPRELGIGHVRDHTRQGVPSRWRRSVHQAGPRLVAGPPDQHLVFLVRHVVDPLAKRVAIGPCEVRLQPASVLGLDRMPARRREHRLHPTDADPRNDPIETLAIQVDDHRHVPELAQALLEDRLPDVAFVKLRIADQGHEPPIGLARDALAEMRPQVAIGQGGEHRGDRPEAHGARGEVDRIGILGPRRIRLQAAEVTQPKEHRRVQVAEQVLDRVVGRRRVRLHRDQVAGSQPAEVERGQDRHDRCARRLVPADLDPIAVRADVVGLVDHPDRQPQHAARDRVQGRIVGPTGGRSCRHVGDGHWLGHSLCATWRVVASFVR